MSNYNQQLFDTTLSINPYRGTYYLRAGSKLSFKRNPAFDKKQGTISYINTKDFITALIGVSKNLADDDIAFVIESKAYEELALDTAVEYSIDYAEAVGEANDKERFFHVFVVDPLVLQETFDDPVSKVQYVDQIVPVPLLLKSLYTNEIISDDDIHCFVYFQENDAFFTLYRDQEFLYTKSIKYSFREMYDRFCELLGEQITFADFTNLIKDEGLSTQNAEYQKYLIKLFGELFLHINDILTYAKRAYEIETVSEIYIGSQIGNIIGLDEYCQTYIGFESQPFDFNYGLNTEEYVDQIHQLMQLYVNDSEEDRYETNFSTFHRPPPFFQRHSGKLFLVTAASLMLAFAYPVMNWTASYAEEVHKAALEKEYSVLHPKRVSREMAINKELAERELAREQLAAAQGLFAERKATLHKIHEVKVNYPMKGKIIASLSKDLNKHKVGVSEIRYEEDNRSKAFIFNLIAKKDKQITNLIEYLTKNRTDKYYFSTEKIYLDDNSSHYRSELKVVLK